MATKDAVTFEMDGDRTLEMEWSYFAGSPGCWYRSNGDPGGPARPR